MTTRNACLETAFHIGARLARDAIWDGERCNWFAPVYENFNGSQQLACGTLAATLYDGTAGIGLFLAELHRATGDPLAARTAAGAIEHALDRATDIPEALHRGFYTGFLGIGFAAMRIGTALGRDDFSARGLAMVRRAVALPPDGKLAIDVMSGNAGMIPVLLSLAEVCGDSGLCDAAVDAGGRLLDMAERSERGLSWNAMGEMAELVDLSSLSDDLVAEFREKRRPNLTGLSHGAGGVGWALLELGAATGEKRFTEAGRDAFSYEDSWFDAATDRWPDLRKHDHDDPGGPAPAAWCHGAVGIGLARIRALRLLGDRALLPGIEAALRISARSVVAQLARRNANYSLCHGVAGDAELFLDWTRATGDAEAWTLVEEIARQGMTEYGDSGRAWPSGTPGAGESPGLMLGLAGTGYFYLRVFDPAQVPSILLVAPATVAQSDANTHEALVAS
ncbi:lanthionine synthetase LanC family protein [Sphingomonas sp.]|uniref:lanthionine synthetase LanC family protein n=1 Tax=Sphingomonas sp. TaxID=28214 RepID=UPI0025DCEDCB|nr:lanthionine synthetase LanC family protein [Sphingomonas sp.]